jgi:hypothetical protein
VIILVVVRYIFIYPMVLTTLHSLSYIFPTSNNYYNILSNYMEQHTKFRAPAAKMNSGRKRAAHPPPRRMLPTDQRHLLKHLEGVERTWEGSFFLDETHRDLLRELNLSFPIRPYPADMAPALTLDIIRLRLKDRQYRDVEEFQAEIERLEHSSARKWGRDHYITKAAGVVLNTMKKAITNLPDRKPPVTKTGKRKLSDTALKSTEITSAHKTAVLDEIADIERKHAEATIYPDDDRLPMMQVDETRRDLNDDRYGSLEELLDAVWDIFDKSDECNGPRHHITNRVYDLYKYINELVKSELRRCETQNVDELSSQNLDLDEERSQRQARQRNTKQQERIKERHSHYRSGKASKSTYRPRNLVMDKIEEKEKEDQQFGIGAGKDTYARHLRHLSKELPTQQQISALFQAAHLGPIVLGRTASQTNGNNFNAFHKKSNGSTTCDVLLPAADTHPEDSYPMHPTITDLTQGELVYMCGKHLVWDDLRGDELLSYSKDPLFLVVHALGRHHNGEGNVTIQFLDRRKAKDPSGNVASFYSALDLFTIFEVPRWGGWSKPHKTKLHTRKFTQEYLSHGPVLYTDSAYKQARIDDLIKDGLYDIFPEFEAPEDHRRAGLYTLQVICRKSGYPPGKEIIISPSNPEASLVPMAKPSMAATSPNGKTSKSRASKPKTKTKVEPIYSYDNCARLVSMTVNLLNTVRKVTINFRLLSEDVDSSSLEPPLHAFICFFTFDKRQKEDPIFMEWIRNHYQGTILPMCNLLHRKTTTLTITSSTRSPGPLR